MSSSSFASESVAPGAASISRRALLCGLAGLAAGSVLAGVAPVRRALADGEVGGASQAREVAGDATSGDATSSEGRDASFARDAGAVLPADIVDDLGRTVHVESLDRVIACMGSFAKVWELAGGTLVGVTDDALADYPELDLPEDVAVVGSFTELNLEAIAALEPTLVLLSAASGGRGKAASQADLQGALEDLGIPAAYFKVTLFDDYARMLRSCCDLTGRDDLYRTNVEDVRARIDDVVGAALGSARLSADGAPLVAAMVTYSGGVRLQGADTMVGAMLADLGASNVADLEPGLLQDWSLESLIACDPDFVFVIPMGNDAEATRRALEEQTADDPAWSLLTAVREGRFFTLEPSLFQYKPLERWDESYRVLAGYLYGDASGVGSR